MLTWKHLTSFIDAEQFFTLIQVSVWDYPQLNYQIPNTNS